jgi:archaemetzincin
LNSKDLRPEGKAFVDLVPLGPAPDVLMNVIAANIQAVMGLDVDIFPARPKPEYAFVPGRGQYQADKIVKALASIKQGAPLKIGVTACDICNPIVTYLFGESQMGGKAALVSFHRLKCDDAERFFLRTAKIGLHELGHLLGVGHCRAPSCLMRFAANLEAVDAIPMRLCEACEYEVGRSLKKFPEFRDCSPLLNR